MRVEVRSTIDSVWDAIVYFLKMMENNEITIKMKKTTTQDQVKLNILSFLLGQSDPLGH